MRQTTSAPEQHIEQISPDRDRALQEAARATAQLKQARDDYRTLLNPDNMRDFLDYYESGSYAQIMHRFRLTSKR